MYTDNAPILLFVYNRPMHTWQTLEALKKNHHASESDLVIYSDGAKSSEEASRVTEVRDYIKSVNGFKSITCIERNDNWGLAANIIDGVTDVVQRYGKVIVMEDDILTSPAFLSFMNQALDFYEEKKKVWHVSGWNYPIESKGLGDVFLWRAMNCWGWATWADRWQYFEKKPETLVKIWSDEEKSSFDLGDSGVFWSQVEANVTGKINTWAIFWYATIFQNNGMCLNPVTSYVANIGQDGSGVHCGESSGYRSQDLCLANKLDLTTDYKESELAVNRILEFYKRQKKPLYIRIINKVSRLLSGRNLFQ
ncbi:hypothetical protein [Vreelandella janggokensis]|uniref:hypothetical protein n=1 Tax=Vreelandella janggokensis TaxID=370767 RepID=UPI00285C0F4C|nr:hypothetical protein [Halomonas janggokensis]MDR5886701.1 hypothetical protein [Halomonas janggokensis]